ncbi:MAG: universal stress protein [Rhodospirillaceae bacterium]|nr:universal stress protein [Rhodospirillaceae bacterium]MBT6117482.1 universal stress protein [Rhodospirillaceae bacterium]
MQTILAAVDGSTHADKALAFAADLAAKYGARLILVHAALHGAHAGALAQMAEERGLSAELIGELDEADRTPSPGIAVAGAYTLVPVSGSTLHRLGEELLEKAAETARRRGVEKVSVKTADGDPAKAILAFQEAENADCIVLGSRGLSDLAGLMMGSVSHKVGHLAPCTCITVK